MLGWVWAAGARVGPRRADLRARVPGARIGVDPGDDEDITEADVYFSTSYIFALGCSPSEAAARVPVFSRAGGCFAAFARSAADRPLYYTFVHKCNVSRSMCRCDVIYLYHSPAPSATRAARADRKEPSWRDIDATEGLFGSAPGPTRAGRGGRGGSGYMF